jgi:acetylglutamate kinase
VRIVCDGLVVVKLGGGALAGDGLAAVAADLAGLAAAARRLVVVHGGGAQTSTLQRRLGDEPRIVAGRRVTDEAALDAIKMVVGGKLNIELCGALLAAGARPVGLHGASALAVEACRRPPSIVAGAGPEPIDLGLVGDVVGVRHALFTLLLDAGFLPVVACVGAARDGSVYNINADVVAHRLAAELGAEVLVLVTDVRGVMRSLDDPASRIPVLRRRDAELAVATGLAKAGMIPKLEASFAALEAGVGRIHIVGRLTRGELAREIAQPGSVGTLLCLDPG